MHPHYASRMFAFAPYINPEELTTAEHRDIIVKLMKETALQCRDKLFLSDPESNHSTLTRLSSISRAVWTQDSKLASILIQHSSLGQQFSFLSNDTVSCINTQEFESRYMEAKTEHFNKERETLQRESNWITIRHLVQKGGRPNALPRPMLSTAWQLFGPLDALV